MDVMKEKWETPRTVYEGFVVDQYIAVCVDDGHFEIDDTAVAVESSDHFWLDYNRNGILDDSDKQYKTVTSNNSGKDPNEDISYWAWNINGDPTRYRFFQLQNGNQWIGYKEIYVSNKNHS